MSCRPIQDAGLSQQTQAMFHVQGPGSPILEAPEAEMNQTEHCGELPARRQAVHLECSQAGGLAKERK